MIRAWLGCWLLLCFSLHGDELLYYDERHVVTPLWWALVVAFCCFAFRERRADALPADRRGALAGMVGLACVGALVVPVTETRLAFGCIAMGGLAQVALRSRVRRWSAAAVDVGGVLLLMEVLKRALWPLLARVHDLPFLSGPAAACLRLAGIDSRAGSDALAVSSVESWVSVTVAAEKLAVAPLVLFAGAALWAIWSSDAERKGRAALAIIAIAALYAWGRMLVLAAAVADGEPMSVFYEPRPVLASLAPLVLLWGISIRPRPRREEVVPRFPSLRVATVAALAVLVLTSALTAHDPGVRKPGRLLVDEGHSEWERTDEPLDRGTYGNKTTYNYFSMVDCLRRYYPVVDRSYGRLSADVLRDYDVLILKTPTLMYADDEVAAILEFVRQGGGVWLIGDHTDVFGSSTCLNQIGRELGVELVVDSLDDVVHHEKQIYRRPELGRHPTNQWMPDCLLATGCSLDVAWHVEASMMGGTLWGDRPIYSNVNFIGDVEVDPDERFGVFAQGAAGAYGAGRFSVFTDSTSLSNFTFYFPGKWEHTLSVVEWLNHREGNRWFVLNRCAAILSAGAVLVWLILRRRGPWLSLVLSPRVVEVLALGLFGGLAAADRLDGWTSPLPMPHSPPTVVAFEQEHGQYRLPLVHETHYWDTDSYHTMYVWAQRVGLVPRVSDTLEEGLLQDALVLIRPRREFEPAERRAIREWVHDGGRLLVVDEHVAQGSTAADVLSMFALRFGPQVSKPTLDLSSLPSYLAGSRLELPGAATVEGGRPFLRTEDGRVVGASQSVGRGVVAAVGLARSFAVDRYGSPQGTPKDEQIALAEIEYHTLTDVLGLRATDPSSSSDAIGLDWRAASAAR